MTSAFETEIAKIEDSASDNGQTVAPSRVKLAPFVLQPATSLKRRVNTQGLLTITSAGWLTFLVVTGAVDRAIPWVIGLSTVLLTALPRWLALRKELDFSLSTIENSFEFDLEELAAITAAVSSAVLVVAALIWHIDLSAPRTTIKRQVVDIELVSPSDAIDRSEILPSTSAMPERKFKGAPRTIISDRLSGTDQKLTAPVAAKGKSRDLEAPFKKMAEQQVATKELVAGAEQTKKAGKIEMAEVVNAPQFGRSDKILEAATETAQGNTFAAPSRWKTIVVSKSKKGTELANYRAAEPAEMIESIDNDGEHTFITSQSGGRSNGGTGAASNLHEYLKQVNKRVKRNWIPPRGIDRIAVIEFRIDESGALTRTRTLSHSGPRDIEAEAAAIAAITKSFPGAALPADVKNKFLDIRYTFNYRFNQIEDVAAE